MCQKGQKGLVAEGGPPPPVLHQLVAPTGLSPGSRVPLEAGTSSPNATVHPPPIPSSFQEAACDITR